MWQNAFLEVIETIMCVSGSFELTGFSIIKEKDQPK